MARNIDTVVILDQASGYLQIDMLEAYAQKYKNRVIIAGTIVERSTPLAKDVKWHKITKYDRSTPFRRIYTWLAATFGMFWLVLTRYRKAHIVAITNPPFSIFVPWMLRCSYDAIIYDMYPDALVNYGYFDKTTWIYKTWVKFNKSVFKKARKVFTLTEGMKNLVKVYTQIEENVLVIPLWSEAADFKHIAKDENLILSKTKTNNKFNIVYSGNLGMTHPVEKLMELAEYLHPDLFSIIIIGGGAKEKLLKDIQIEKKYTHVFLLPWQPISLLSHNLQAGDLNVVTLDKEASDLSIPSKTFNILSVGNPILGICSMNSSLASLISLNDCGLVHSDDDIKKLAQNIISLEGNKNRIAELKQNSLRTSMQFTKENALAYL